MSAERALLARLCALCGIATGYHDIWGRWREVPEASLHALLGQFGVEAVTPEHAAQAEHALEAARWRAPLAPVVTIAERRAPWRVRIRMPAARRTLRWQLEEENGARHESAFAAQSSTSCPRSAKSPIPQLRSERSA